MQKQKDKKEVEKLSDGKGFFKNAVDKAKDWWKNRKSKKEQQKNVEAVKLPEAA